MSKENKSFENIPWQVIKNYLAHSESVGLNEEHKYMIDRVFSLARVFDRHPQRKTALALHRAKYPDISRNTAARDLEYAMRLNNSRHTFDYPFWQNWLLADCVDQIQAAKAKGDLMAWAAGLNALIKVIGKKPIQETDPKLIEKHTFLLQVNHRTLGPTINVDDLDKIPSKVKEEIVADLFQEITEEEAEWMLNT
jgi:hypothetical protein